MRTRIRTLRYRAPESPATGNPATGSSATGSSATGNPATEYTWTAEIRAAPGPDGHRHRLIHVRIWTGGKNSTPLQADLADRPAAADTPGTGPRSGQAYPYPAAQDIRTLIEFGLAAGWTPTAPGPPFQLTSAAEPGLPDFTLTDLLWLSQKPK